MFYKDQKNLMFPLWIYGCSIFNQLIKLTSVTKTDMYSKNQLHLQGDYPDAHHRKEL